MIKVGQVVVIVSPRNPSRSKILSGKTALITKTLSGSALAGLIYDQDRQIFQAIVLYQDEIVSYDYFVYLRQKREELINFAILYGRDVVSISEALEYPCQQYNPEQVLISKEKVSHLSRGGRFVLRHAFNDPVWQEGRRPTKTKLFRHVLKVSRSLGLGWTRDKVLKHVNELKSLL